MKAMTLTMIAAAADETAGLVHADVGKTGEVRYMHHYHSAVVMLEMVAAS
jgi:hypothetical protein